MKKLVALFFAGVSSVAAFAIAISAATLGWFNTPDLNLGDEIVNGEVGLRGYFFDGDGLTPSTAFEIVSPIHYYNLTRLQNLGIFPEKRYFQIGHDFGGDVGLACINYDEHGVATYDKYIDMQELCDKTIILPIGGESAPFVGTFDGNGMSLKNLTVSGYPEDIGVFGYVSYEGSVTDLVCENLTINSLGYNSDVTAPDFLLFNANIEDIFDENVSEISKLMSLDFYDGLDSSKTKYELKRHNGLSGRSFSSINASGRLVDNTYLYKGYFQPNYPVRSGEIFTYSWKSSSQLIKAVPMDLDGDGTSEDMIMIDIEALHDSAGTDESFNSGKEMQADARLSLIASVEVDGYVYSRVIQSYVVEFLSNSSVYEDGNYSFSIFCDYVDTGTTGDVNTNYHHGNNIGLLAGHVDGSFTRSYVYGGQFTFNSDGYSPILAETETALIGEIGANVINDIDPELSLVVHGDTGVMNFSKIYSLIRRDMDADEPHLIACGKATPGGETTAINYVSYDDFINEDTIGLYSQYLRHDDPGEGDPHRIIKTSKDMANWATSGVYPINSTSDIQSDFNKVDFLWNNIIQDETGKNRGLGVFKIVTPYHKDAKEHPEEANQYLLSGIGGSEIINGTPKDKVYFSTAEYDHKLGGDGWDSYPPNRAIKVPEYYDINSFTKQFERDFNYVYELKLGVDEMVASKGNNYMYNTDSTFLTQYLSNKLIDKIGDTVPWGTQRFGFMFRSSDNELLTSLSSYMCVGTLDKDDSKQPFEINGVTKYYPEKSIIFRIENENGANVSVVGNGADITVYKNNPDSQDKVERLYSMRSSNISQTDIHRYFTYDVGSGATSEEVVPYSGMGGDDNALYGHIFKLPQGDYCLGSRSGTARIYFLAVQGQTDGTIGDKSMTYIGSAVEDVDFIVDEPSALNPFPFVNSVALFTFKANFNLVSGTVIIGSQIYDDKKRMYVNFEDDPRFLTYLFLYSRHPEHIYYVNGEMFDAMTTLYPRT